MKQIKFIFVIAISLVIASCATSPEIKQTINNESIYLFPQEAAIYGKMDKEIVNAILPSVLAKDEKNIKTIASKTNIVNFAVSSSKEVYAILEGNFPKTIINTALSGNKEWTKENNEWVNTKQNQFLNIPTSSRIFFGTKPCTEIFISNNANTKNPIPEKWQNEWNKKMSIYVAKPVILFNFFKLEDVPLKSIILSVADFKENSNGKILPEDKEMSIHFEFGSANEARIFSPITRLFVFGLLSYMCPDRTASANENALWETNGNIITVENIPIDIYGNINIPFLNK